MVILVEILDMVMYVLLLCTYVLIVITEKYAICYHHFLHMVIQTPIYV